MEQHTSQAGGLGNENRQNGIEPSNRIAQERIVGDTGQASGIGNAAGGNGNPPTSEQSPSSTRPDESSGDAGESTTGNRRRPGRPRKSETSAASQSGPFGTIELGSEQSPPKRGRPKTKKPLPESEAKALASALVFSANMMVTVLVGSGAAISTIEETLIVQPTARTLQRLGADRIEQAQGLTDPVMLIIGLALWSRRIAIVYQQKMAAEKQAQQAAGPVHAVPPSADVADMLNRFGIGQ
jgi:hypothetical protein